MNGSVMRRQLAIFGTGLAVSASVAGLSAGGAAASTHLGGTTSFPDTLCGFSGVTTLSTEDNFGSLANGGTYDNGRFVQTFIASNGRGVEIEFGAGTARSHRLSRTAMAPSRRS